MVAPATSNRLWRKIGCTKYVRRRWWCCYAVSGHEGLHALDERAVKVQPQQAARVRHKHVVHLARLLVPVLLQPHSHVRVSIFAPHYRGGVETQPPLSCSSTSARYAACSMWCVMCSKIITLLPVELAGTNLVHIFHVLDGSPETEQSLVTGATQIFKETRPCSVRLHDNRER